MKTCKLCGKSVFAALLCYAHYRRIARHGSPESREHSKRLLRSGAGVLHRFWSKVNKTEGCWLWTAGRFSNGYGVFYNGKSNTRAHRFSWALEHGEVPENLYVLHRCDNRRCVNPAHLFLGTAADNAIDMVNKGRSTRGINTRSGNAA